MNPLRDLPPPGILLKSSPIQRALCNVQFSPVMKINDGSGASFTQFQDTIRGEYPNLRLEQEQSVQLQIDDSGNVNSPVLVNLPVWRFGDKLSQWEVSLTRESISLSTGSAYVGRDDFVRRMVRLLEAVETEFQPAQSVRVGCRYLNVIEDSRLEKLDRHVRAEFLGFATEDYSPEFAFSDCRARFAIDQKILSVRWGGLEPNMVHDPSFMISRPTRTWFMDIDCFTNEVDDFSVSSLKFICESLTERVYTMFRWAVTEDFLSSCNAE